MFRLQKNIRVKTGAVNMIRRLKGITGSYSKINNVAAGIGPDAGLHPLRKVPIVQVAEWNEFGTETQPPRPFLRSTLYENQFRYRIIVQELMKKVKDKQMSVEEAQRILGQNMVADIQDKIMDMREPANAEATIDNKGFDDPLIHTETMLNSIEWFNR